MITRVLPALTVDVSRPGVVAGPYMLNRVHPNLS